MNDEEGFCAAKQVSQENKYTTGVIDVGAFIQTLQTNVTFGNACFSQHSTNHFAFHNFFIEVQQAGCTSQAVSAGGHGGISQGKKHKPFLSIFFAKIYV